MGSCKQLEHRRVGKLRVDLGEDLEQAADLHDAKVHGDHGEDRAAEPDVEPGRKHGVCNDADEDEAEFRALVPDTLTHDLAGELMPHERVADAECPVENDQQEQGNDGYLRWEAIADGCEERFEK